MVRNLINLAIVFLATGIWHGAAWTFIAWGCWHGAFVIFERLTGWSRRNGGRLLSVSQHIYALLVIVFGWVLFRADSFTQARGFWYAMSGCASSPTPVRSVWGLTPPEIAAMAAALVCSTPVCSGILRVAQSSGWRGWLVNAYLLLLFYLSVVQIVASTYNPFIYFRF